MTYKISGFQPIAGMTKMGALADNKTWQGVQAGELPKKITCIEEMEDEGWENDPPSLTCSSICPPEF